MRPEPRGAERGQSQEYEERRLSMCLHRLGRVGSSAGAARMKTRGHPEAGLAEPSGEVGPASIEEVP